MIKNKITKQSRRNHEDFSGRVFVGSGCRSSGTESPVGVLQGFAPDVRPRLLEVVPARDDPIENLLARRGKNIMVQVADGKQAKLMAEILEKGVDGVVLNTTDINEIKKTAEILQGIGERVEL